MGRTERSGRKQKQADRVRSATYFNDPDFCKSANGSVVAQNQAEQNTAALNAVIEAQRIAALKALRKINIKDKS